MWDDKPYYSLDYYLKQTFGEKVYRVSLNGGMSCPNRDGTLGNSGCIFCSEGGSGDFTEKENTSITQQIELQKQKLKNKTDCHKYIAYFQAYTNTYAPVDYLRNIFLEAISHPDIVVLSIATRPDCLSPPILRLLKELRAIKPVWVELGLQTMHTHTRDFIKQGFSLSCFEDAVKTLKTFDIPVIIHVILGFPTETTTQMLETIQYVGTLGIQGIKLQLLHILQHTALGDYYQEKPFPMLTFDEYCHLIGLIICALPTDLVIHRLTGDGPKHILIAPLWSMNKKAVLNQIHKTMKQNEYWQGKHLGGILCQKHLPYTN